MTIADERWGKQGDALSKSKFTWKAISQDMIDVYAHVLGATIEPVSRLTIV